MQSAEKCDILIKDTDFIVTKYVYGLGLIGEEKLGCFKTYHFDMRGSTVAITDMCGNVIDTFKYDTYGKVTEHIGNSFVIFGYNGRDGVVTDKNGLIYMRARYYSPEMKRFVNADILHGTISDSTSLNRYSYVNGNPVSFVDPFGLSAENRGNYGAIEYDSNIYNIYIPTGNENFSEWSVVDIIEGSDFKTVFKMFKFLASYAADDFNGVAKGDFTIATNNKGLKFASVSGLSLGVLNSLINSLETDQIFYKISFYKKGDQNIAIVQLGSADVQNIYQKYANDKPISWLFTSAQTGGDISRISYSSQKVYENMTGKSLNILNTYDIQITLDSAHKDDKYSSYMWIGNDGVLMEKPIIYENDSVVMGQRTFLGFVFKPMLDLTIENSTPAAQEYQNLLIPSLESHNVTVH